MAAVSKSANLGRRLDEVLSLTEEAECGSVCKNVFAACCLLVVFFLCSPVGTGEIFRALGFHGTGQQQRVSPSREPPR